MIIPDILNSIISSLIHLPRKMAVGAIGIYQQTISPDHGWLLRGRYPHGFCRFYPSCSEYAKQAITSRGLIIGGVRAVMRIFRCNPWASPSVDLPV